jgi:hypothetical protein
MSMEEVLFVKVPERRLRRPREISPTGGGQIALRPRSRARRALLSFVLAAAFIAGLAPVARAEFSSKNVAYVYDKTLFPCSAGECGMNDPRSAEEFSPGGSIFRNAVGGVAPGKENEGKYTPSGGEQVTLTNVTLEELDANPKLLEAGGFDTAILYETCKIAEHPKALAEINAFIESARKVMIFDADGCAPGTELGEPNWSGFVFPFATNNPGPRGAAGPYTFVESSTLTSGLSTGEQEGDAVGDANIFVSSSVHWFQAIAATNISGVTGTVMAYSRTASGGLALYEGEDFWFSFGPNAHLKQVFDDMLNQHWNPDKLPSTSFVCKSCSSEVSTKLSSTVVPEGTPVTDSATIVGASGAGTATGKATFTVYSDSHCQLPVAGQAQSVAVAAGGTSTSPITLPPGTYYFQTQYFGDTGNFPGLSACGSEVLIVAPTKPPVEKRKPVVIEHGEIEWEIEFPEPGEVEFEGEVLEEAELQRVRERESAFTLGGVTLVEPIGIASRKCKKGFVKKHNKCVRRRPVHYSKHKLTITTPGTYRLRLKPTGKVLRALKRGKKLNVRITLKFTPAMTSVHLSKSAKVKLRYIKKRKHHKK